MRKVTLNTIRVRAKPGQRTRGWLVAGAAGAAGRARPRRHQGQQARGRRRHAARRASACCRLWWRHDRLARPRTLLPVRRIRHEDGWCEDPRDRRYNQPVRLGPAHSGDRLKRADHLYDLIIELDHNTRPRVAGRGSAVFVHVARPGFAPTAGCVALQGPALRRLAGRIGPRTRIVIG